MLHRPSARMPVRSPLQRLVTSARLARERRARRLQLQRELAAFSTPWDQAELQTLCARHETSVPDLVRDCA